MDANESPNLPVPVPPSEPLQVPPEPLPPEPPPSWPRAVLWMFALAVFAASTLYVFKSCRDLPVETIAVTANKTVQVLTNVGRTLVEMASKFNQGSITMALTSTGTKLESTKHFQFKRLTQTEIFTHTDQSSTAFGYIPLPEVIVEARAPVEYIYYLDLEAPWRLVVRDRIVHVFTPQIFFNKPSVDVSKIVFEVKRGSLFRDTESARDNLQKSISSLSYLKARENLGLVRDTGREPVADFVRQWLMHSFTDGSNYLVKVYFPGDQQPQGLELAPDKPAAVPRQ